MSKYQKGKFRGLTTKASEMSHDFGTSFEDNMNKTEDSSIGS